MTDNSYRILAVDAKESHLLQDAHWVPSRSISTVTALHRDGLRGFAGDVYYTDAALDALVEDAELRDTGKDTVLPDGKLAPLMDEGRSWKMWRRIRPHFTAVRPFEAWLHLHEASVEELVERRLGFVAITSQVTLEAAQLEAVERPLVLINNYRAQCSAAVRAQAANRLVRIAASRVVVTEDQSADGSVVVRAEWRALPAAGRTVPAWLASGLDSQSFSKVG